jgi:hypothetical protein
MYCDQSGYFLKKKTRKLTQPYILVSSSCKQRILINSHQQCLSTTHVVYEWVISVMYLGLVDRPFVPQIRIVPSFISRGTPRHAARETSIIEGRKLNIPILPAARNEPQLLGSFTCPNFETWDRVFHVPPEGRHAEDFYIRKIRRLRPANSGTRGQHANH